MTKIKVLKTLFVIYFTSMILEAAFKDKVVITKNYLVELEAFKTEYRNLVRELHFNNHGNHENRKNNHQF